MYFTINGMDQTLNVPYDANNFSNVLGDPAPRAEFDVWDQGGQLSLDTDQEIIIWDERSVGGLVPSMNFLQNADKPNPVNIGWSAIGGGGTISYSAPNVTFTYANSGIGFTNLQQKINWGYIQVGQNYMVSVYVQATSPVNLQSVIQLQFVDASNNNLGSVIQDVRTPPTTRTRISIQGVAPAGAVQAYVIFGTQATNATNSGTVTLGTPQFEPTWFTGEGVSYPTPDCNPARSDCVTMPDGYVSRACRLFAGIIDDWQVSWQGKLRIWHLSCAGAQGILDDGMINGTYSAQYDDQILTSVISNNFGTGNPRISTNAPNNTAGAVSPIVRGVLMDDQNYTDNSLREVANGLSDSSQYMFGLDPYYRFFYNPAFYNVASFGLSQNPDNVTTFPIYDYQLEKDATQRKRKVKVIGGQIGTGTPAVSQVLDQNAGNVPLAPYYIIPNFDAKVNDSNLLTTATTATRGLAEVSKWGQPKIIITGKAQQYAPVGYIIYLTLPLDNINNMPFVVQQVKGSYLGNALNQYEYTLGHYQPTLIDHIRNANKATNRARVNTGVNNILQTDLTVSEIIAYSEKVTVTPGTSTPAGQYNSAYKHTVLGNSPKVYYRFGEASGTVANDSSGNSLNGTISASGVTYGQAGAILNDTDTALKLDGTAGSIASPAGANPSGWSAFTAEAWINLTNITYVNTPTVCGNALPGTSNTGFNLTLDASGAGIKITIGNGTTNANVHYVVALSAGTWYYIVATWDGTTIRLYVNGVAHGTAALSGTVGTAAGNPTFGSNPASGGFFLPATIDEGAVYNAVLSASQVSANYTAGTTASGATYGGNSYS